LLPSSYRKLPAPKQNLDSHKFKDDCKIEIATMPWLITAYKNLYQHGTEKLLPYYKKNASTLVGTEWKSSGIAVKLKLIKTKYSYWRPK
jgi:hypothetical protein